MNLNLTSLNYVYGVAMGMEARNITNKLLKAALLLKGLKVKKRFNAK